jgi:uncharacterized protein (TIGR02284 family)
MTSESPIAMLNRAIEMCRNGEEGFAQAASAVSDAHLRKVLGEYSEQRAQFGLQLQAVVKRLGAEPEKHGTVAGVLHRGWMGLKGAISGGSESAILDECARGEDAALETYREVVNNELPPDARELIASQRLQIEEVRGQLAELHAHLKTRPAVG